MRRDSKGQAFGFRQRQKGVKCAHENHHSRKVRLFFTGGKLDPNEAFVNDLFLVTQAMVMDPEPESIVPC